jgi:hypothetical protein
VTHALVRRACEAALKTWADAEPMPVQWQNQVLDPEPAAYVRAILLPAPTEAPDIEGQGRTFTGIWQVSIVRPIGEGAGPAEAIAAELAAIFKPGLPITVGAVKLYFLQPLSPAAPVDEPGRFVVPCSATYQSTVY